MTIVTIIRSPEVGEVGKEATFLCDDTLKTGTELRYYLAYAPTSSKLPTLETVAAADRQNARLRTDKMKRGVFVPDVPGHYQVECHDVTVVKTPKLYHHAPEVPDTDNDFAGAPVITLGDGTEYVTRYGYADFRVPQTITRTIGEAPHLLTLALRDHDAIEVKLPDAVTATPSAQSTLAAAAVYDDSILGCLELLRIGYVAGGAKLQQDLATLQALREMWNLHLAAATTWVVHTGADTTNWVPAAPVTDLAGALTQLAALRTAYTAHASSGAYHSSPDASNLFLVGVVNPTDLASGIAFARLFFQIMVWGETDSSIYVNGYSGHFAGIAHANPGDPNANITFDFSPTLPGLLRATNKLTELFNAHLLRTTQAAMHASADVDNKLRPSPTDLNTPSLVQWANAFADSIDRHASDMHLDANGALVPYGAAKHQNVARAVKIGRRAGDISSAIGVIELCCLAIETHALDGGATLGGDVLLNPAHAGPGLGFRNRSGPWPLMTRLQAHWRRATQSTGIILPRHLNKDATALLALGWK